MPVPTLNFNRWLRRADQIVASSSEINRDPNNLKFKHPADVWIATSAGANFLELGITTSAVVPWREIVMGYHNLRTVTDTWRIRSANTQPALTATPVTDSGVIPVISGATVPDTARIANSLPAPAIYREATPQTTAWIRIDFDTALPPRIGTLAIDAEIVASKPIPAEIQIGNPARFEFQHLTRENMLEIQDILTVIPEGPIMVVLNPLDNEYTHHRVVWGDRRVPNEPVEFPQGQWRQRWVIDPFLPVT